ncbi:cytochrome c oxidase assembly protein [Phenylobacterium soli]|uniref:Cytochrome c oxidase assembly protein CtaG n=1 Tax=Phenylobacterium soli TaxID=2170551 RepID=A0A328AI47_9CAUL|nr:cytochrome c oxidase assembly protein [Phenylobacterium soli]RAK54185.1 cytochrome c oxidase assembly protein [Phenylobacterium soli]
MSGTGSDRPPLTAEQRRNRKLGIICAVTFFGMIGAAYAAVPAYKAFCQATGYDGTVTRAKAAPTAVVDHTITVRFDANTNGLPWDFEAEQVAQPVKLGETKLAFFKVTNHADHPVTGRAVFNVVPEQAGAYFRKLQCFCFSDQTIGAGQTVEMPVLYFVDPKYASDFETKGQKEVTLSYTFFPATDAKAPPETAR